MFWGFGYFFESCDGFADFFLEFYAISLILKHFWGGFKFFLRQVLKSWFLFWGVLMVFPILEIFRPFENFEAILGEFQVLLGLCLEPLGTMIVCFDRCCRFLGLLQSF